jgi:GH24 family phage-related lysozyme (muramidase)
MATVRRSGPLGRYLEGEGLISLQDRFRSPSPLLRVSGPVGSRGWLPEMTEWYMFHLPPLELRAPVFSTTQADTPPTAEEYYDDIVVHEGKFPFMYIDTRGYVTVGVGNLVASAATAVSLPFVQRNTGTPATAAQKIVAFNRIRGKPAARRARYYKAFTKLDLPDASIKTLALSRLRTEFLPGLRGIFPRFDEFPLPARRALVDMAYNLGVTGLKKFTHLVRSANAQHWAAAARECHRSTCRASRNEWTQQQFEQAAGGAPGASP